MQTIRRSVGSHHSRSWRTGLNAGFTVARAGRRLHVSAVRHVACTLGAECGMQPAQHAANHLQHGGRRRRLFSPLRCSALRRESTSGVGWPLRTSAMARGQESAEWSLASS